VELASGVLELRPYNQQEQTSKLFIRTEADLQLYNAGLQQVNSLVKYFRNNQIFKLSTVYKWPVRSFERIAHMDEIAVVTNEGMVFHGQIGSEDFTRIKANEKIIIVSSKNI
jgi:hypothetical protein